MTLIANQPFPDLPAWEDLSGTLVNGWAAETAFQSLQAFAEGNMVTVFGRLKIGSARIGANMPREFWPSKTQGVTALVFRGPSCVAEIWGGGQLVMSNASLGVTEAQMIAEHGGKELFFSGSYPRRA